MSSENVKFEFCCMSSFFISNSNFEKKCVCILFAKLPMSYYILWIYTSLMQPCIKIVSPPCDGHLWLCYVLNKLCKLVTSFASVCELVCLCDILFWLLLIALMMLVFLFLFEFLMKLDIQFN